MFRGGNISKKSFNLNITFILDNINFILNSHNHETTIVCPIDEESNLNPTSKTPQTTVVSPFVETTEGNSKDDISIDDYVWQPTDQTDADLVTELSYPHDIVSLSNLQTIIDPNLRSCSSCGTNNLKLNVCFCCKHERTN